MSGYCAICTKRGPIGWSNLNVPEDLRTQHYFCSIAHERMWKTMSETQLNRCEIAAIENSLKTIGQCMANRGIVQKSFAEMDKAEICGVIADIVRTFRKQLDVENETDIPY